VVEVEGVTLFCPEAGTLPIPLSIVTESAFVADQVRVALDPDAILEGLALSVAEGFDELPELEPPTPEHAIAISNRQFNGIHKNWRVDK
jgi:hypothetical protein